MRSDPPSLRRGEIVAGTGALAVLVILFALPWMRAGGVGRTGWEALALLRWLIVVMALTALALVAAQARLAAPALPVSLSVLATVLGALTALLLIIRILTTGATPLLGAYLGLAAAIVTAGGAFASLRAEQGWTPGPEHPVETLSLSKPPGR